MLVFEDADVSDVDAAAMVMDDNVHFVDLGRVPGMSDAYRQLRRERRQKDKKKAKRKKQRQNDTDDPAMPILAGESSDESGDEAKLQARARGVAESDSDDESILTSSSEVRRRSVSSTLSSRQSSSRRVIPESEDADYLPDLDEHSADSSSDDGSPDDDDEETKMTATPRRSSVPSTSSSRSAPRSASSHSSSRQQSSRRVRSGYANDEDVPNLHSSPESSDAESSDDNATISQSSSTHARSTSCSSSSSSRSPNSSPSDELSSSVAHLIVARDGVVNAGVIYPCRSSKLDPATSPIAKQHYGLPTEWNVSPRDAAGFFLLSHSTHSEIKVVVRQNRLKKAMEKLHPEALQSVLFSRTNCTCSGNCNNKFTFGEVLDMRSVLFGDSSIDSEQAVTEKAVNILQSFNEHAVPNKSLTYFGQSTRSNARVAVCARFWAVLYGLCESKMKKVRSMVKHTSRIAVHGRTNASSPKQDTKKNQCHAFWTHFFNENCQKPTDSIRLFPVNKPFLFIYDQFFTPWFQKLNRATAADDDELAWQPSFECFRKARQHPDFKDVKHRPKHYHARCRDCDELSAIRLRGFVNDEQKLAFDIAFKAHQAEARSWHEHEESVKAESRRNGGRNSVVIGYDDTSALELPKFTNRDVKNLSKSRLQVIPFNLTNYTSGETAYVYTLKGRYPKGANRLCTVLYRYLHKLKHGTHPSRYARKLYLHADNYAENKNNTLFMFATHLVMLGWYDEVYIEYGPPGHTHNGTDAVHRIHNQVAGNFTSLTLGQFQQTWKHAWRKDFSMPAAVINDAHLDFVNYYEPYKQAISGFTNTLHDPRSVKAFKIQWSRKITAVEMLWKQCADDTDRWLGADGKVESEGFFMLKMLPPGRPSVVPPMKKLMLKQWINELTGPGMLRQCKAHVALESEAIESIAWLKQCATTCRIPFEFVDPELKSDEKGHDEPPATSTLPRSGWGPRVKVGIPSAQGDFYLMTDTTLPADEETFWKLPADLAAIVDADALAALDARRVLEGLPIVRYQNKRSGAPNAPPRRKASESVMSDNDDEAEVRENQLLEDPDSPSESHVHQNVIEEKQPDREARSEDYGADFSDCKKNCIAVVLTEFEEGERLGTGLEFYMVGSVHAHNSEEEDDYFLPNQAFIPNNPNVYVTQESCLSSSWRTVSYNKREAAIFKTTKVLGWQVLYYFKAFNKRGRGLFCLSDKNREAILECGRTHNVVLFYEEPARENARALLSDERLYSSERREDESDEAEQDPEV